VLTLVNDVVTTEFWVRGDLGPRLVTVYLNGHNIYSDELRLSANTTLTDTGTIFGNVLVDGGTFDYYEKWITVTGTVTVTSGVVNHGWKLNQETFNTYDVYGQEWRLNQATDQIVITHADWTIPDSQGTLSVVTIINLLLLCIPAFILGLLMPEVGAPVGILIMSIVMIATNSLPSWMLIINVVTVGLFMYRRG
jgi:hypothetical protein